MSEQCELCLGYTSEILKRACEECQDKAAGHDIRLRERNQLLSATNGAIDLFNDFDSEKTDKPEIDLMVGRALGMLRIARDYCNISADQSMKKMARKN